MIKRTRTRGRTPRMSELLGKLRQKISGGPYYYRLTVANGVRKEFSLGTCDFEEAFSARVIKNFHRLILRLIAEGVDPVAFTEKLCEQNKDVVIIMDEIGCGIVPAEKADRIRREAVGRCGCIIAGKCDTVIHMVCGIPSYLKGEPNED